MDLILKGTVDLILKGTGNLIIKGTVDLILLIIKWTVGYYFKGHSGPNT